MFDSIEVKIDVRGFEYEVQIAEFSILAIELVEGNAEALFGVRGGSHSVLDVTHQEQSQSEGVARGRDLFEHVGGFPVLFHSRIDYSCIEQTLGLALFVVDRARELEE